MTHDQNSPPAPFLTVVIMAFNEAANISPVVAEIVGALNDIGRPYEILIVDDGSSDGTSAIADEIAGKDSAIRVLHHGENLGLGPVYRSGFTEARGEFLTFFPADGQFPATIINDFASVAGNFDLVLGYLPERRNSKIGSFLSFCERLLYRALFGPLPRFQGIMMIRRAILERTTLKSEGRGWAIIMELIIRAQKAGFRITSRPTPYRPRMSGSSKVNNLRTIHANMKQMLTLRGLL